jgi:NUMOD3 motif
MSVRMCLSCGSGFLNKSHISNPRFAKRSFCGHECAGLADSKLFGLPGMSWFFGRGGESHANWKDDDVGYKALHDWLRNHWPEGIPKYCSVCGLEKDLELCNISPTPNPKTYNRDFKNWFFACNLCHRRTDGRLERAVVYNVGRKLPLETIEKMRETHIGKKQSLETKLRISQALTGIKRGPYRKRLVIA